MKMIRVRIRATGQVLEMVPSVAQRMIAGKTAEEVSNEPMESMAVAHQAERAVSAAQAGPAKKTAASKRRA